MAISKVVLNGEVLMDTTVDTVTSENLLKDFQATGADGEKVTGTYEPPSFTPSALTVTPTETSQTFNATGVDGYKPVVVNAINSRYVGTGVPRYSSSDLTFTTSGNDWIIQGESGYYSQTTYYRIPTMTRSISSTYTGANVGTIDRSTSTRYLNLGEGYTYSSFYYKIASVPDGTFNTPKATFNSTTGVFTATASVTSGYLAASSKTSTYTLSAVNATTITPSTVSQTAISAGYYAKGAVTVAAMPTGTAGTPIASKGAVSNHAISVTPSVTNTTGYITGGTKTGTAVTVSASELVSGSETKTENGTYDVTNLAELVVDVDTSTKYTATIQGSSGGIYTTYVQLGDVKYYTSGDTFTYSSGDSLYISVYPGQADSSQIRINGETVASSSTSNSTYTLALPPSDITITITKSGTNIISINYTLPTISITENGTYDVTDYASAAVNVAGGEFYGIYKALAINLGLWADGRSDSYVNYTASEISAWCDSFSGTLYERQFEGRSFYSGSFYFNNLTSIGAYAFGTWGTTGFQPQIGGGVHLYFPNVLSISMYAFQNNAWLQSISAPSCTNIGPSAFFSCSNLFTVNFSRCTTIQSNAFESCKNLSIFSAPACIEINSQAFAKCGIISAIFPECVTVDYGAFSNAKSLTTASFLKATVISSYAFAYCSKLTNLYFPSCSLIHYSAFLRCSALSIINTAAFPVCSHLYPSAFYSCPQLKTACFPACQSLYDYALAYCSKLESIYLLSTSVAILGQQNALWGTPISNSSYLGYFGSIYVRESLLESYKTATNWSAYSSRFVGLTDAEIEAL